jgi:hypothetical protein
MRDLYLTMARLGRQLGRGRGAQTPLGSLSSGGEDQAGRHMAWQQRWLAPTRGRRWYWSPQACQPLLLNLSISHAKSPVQLLPVQYGADIRTDI